MGGMRKTRLSRVSRAIMGRCRHSLASVEELRDVSEKTRRKIDLMGHFVQKTKGCF